MFLRELPPYGEPGPDVPVGVYGYATDETPELMPLPTLLAHRLAERAEAARRSGVLPWPGVSGRAVAADTYGAHCPLPSTGLSGQGTENLERSGTLMARHLAKHVVAAGLARRCTVHLAYSAAAAEPDAVLVDTHRTGVMPEQRIEQGIRDVFPLPPGHRRVSRPWAADLPEGCGLRLLRARGAGAHLGAPRQAVLAGREAPEGASLCQEALGPVRLRPEAVREGSRHGLGPRFCVRPATSGERNRNGPGRGGSGSNGRGADEAAHGQAGCLKSAPQVVPKTTGLAAVP